MFRSAPLAPVRVSARTIRAGRRIAVLEVTVEQDQGPIGQGKAVLLRRSEQPEGTFRQTPGWAAPAPGPGAGVAAQRDGRAGPGPGREPALDRALAGLGGQPDHQARGRAACGSGTSTR